MSLRLKALAPGLAFIVFWIAALEVAARLRPDVVLLDVQLPDTNGFEIAARAASAAPP